MSILVLVGLMCGDIPAMQHEEPASGQATTTAAPWLGNGAGLRNEQYQSSEDGEEGGGGADEYL